MLVLSRKRDQAIVIETASGERIVVRVARASQLVRLAIDAPRDVRIVREELLRREEDAA